MAYNANQSVSFRSGTNVEFIGDNQSGGIISSQNVWTLMIENEWTNVFFEFCFQDLNEGGINLGEMKATDFSNPMYEAIGGTGVDMTGNGSGQKKTNIDNNGTTNPLHDAGELFENGHPLEEGYGKFGSAILSPSSVVHKSSPQIPIRQTALNPNSSETDKDTAALVEEDKSEWSNRMNPHEQIASCFPLWYI